MKVLDAGQLHSGMEDTLTDLDSLNGQIKQIQKSVDGIVQLEDSFKGKGALAIRSFYQEVHTPFLLFLEGFIADYQDVLKQITNALDMLEPDKQGFIRQSFLEDDVQKKLKKIENVAGTLTDEVNRLISSVQDIVSLPRLDDEEFHHNVNQSRTQTNETIEKLHQFDAESTRALEPVEQDIHLMSNYIQQISGMFGNGKLNIKNYATRQLSDNETYQEFIRGVTKKAMGNAFSKDVLLATGAKFILSHCVPMSEVLVDYLLKNYNGRTMDYSVRTMKVLVDVQSNSISHEAFETLKEQRVNAESVVDYKGELNGTYYTLLDGRIIRAYEDGNGKAAYRFVNSIPDDRHEPSKVEQNPFKKTWNSFGEMGKDFTTAWGERADKALDFPYDFMNNMTMGALDMGKGMWEGNQALYQQSMNSPTDFVNWMTMGSVDTVKGTIHPDEQFSKDHWKNSFGLFAMVGGAGLVKVKGNPKPKAAPKAPVPKKPPNVSTKQWISQVKPPVIKSVTNMNEWFRANFLNFERREFAADMPGGNNSASLTFSRAEVNNGGFDGGGKPEKGTKKFSEDASKTDNSISKSEYKALRKKTPSIKIRKDVNPDGLKKDPVYGYEVDKFEADHIVSMKEITDMDGFSRLTKEQRIEVLNLQENFVGLGKSTNASKGAHSWADWKGHSLLGEVPDKVRMQMLEREEQARKALKLAIEKRLK